MKYERDRRIGTRQVAFFSMIVWLLVLIQVASAVEEASGLRGKGTIHSTTSHGNTLFHRRTNENSIEGTMESSVGDHHPTSVFGINDFIFGQNKHVHEQHHSESFTTEATNEIEKFIVGGTNAETRIVGGSNVPETRFPWFVRVLGNGNGFISACGGSLIAPDVIITAAHCDDPNRVMVGPYNLRGSEENMVRRDTTAFRRHPEYNEAESRANYDVMMVRLAEPVLEIAPINMNFNEDYPSVPGEELQILGFGSTIGGPATGLPDGPNKQSTILQQAPTDYVPFDECAVAQDPSNNIKFGISPTRTMVKDFWLCTLREDTSTCFGDSGGPVIKQGSSPQNDLLLGVISGASGYCGNPFLPLLNNRVSHHQEWIKSVGCELSRLPPDNWNCPDRDDDDFTLPAPIPAPIPAPTPVQTPAATPVASPVSSPVSSPVASPVASPVSSPVAAPATTPVASPVATPVATPVAFDLPTTPPTNNPTGVPTVSPAPSISASPTVIGTPPDILLLSVSIGVGVLALCLACSVCLWLILRRRRKRVEDIDQPKGKRKKLKQTKEPVYSPESSFESEEDENLDKSKPYSSRFNTDQPPEEDCDPESQQRPNPADVGSRDHTVDITPQSMEESQAKEEPRKGLFASLFKRKEKPNADAKKDQHGKDGAEQIPIHDTNVEPLAPDSKFNNEETETIEAPKAVYVPRSTASMAVQVDDEADDIPYDEKRKIVQPNKVPYDATSMVVQPDKEFERDLTNDFVFPRTYSPRGRQPNSSQLDDDIRAVVQKGRTNSPRRSHSMDRNQANNYANKQFDRIRPRSHSQEPSRAVNFASKENRNHQPRSRSMERGGASDFASRKNNDNAPYERSNPNEYSSGKERDSRSRGRSKQRLDKRNFSSKDDDRFRSRSRGRSRANEFTSGNKSQSNPLDKNGDPPGEVYADRLIRPRANNFAEDDSTGAYVGSRRSASLDRSRAVQHAKNGSNGDKYSGRRRSSSLDRAPATDFAKRGSKRDKFPDQRRSSSLDRSTANNFANGKGLSPNANSGSGQKKVSIPNAPTSGEPMVQKNRPAGVVITKKADGSVIHEVKRRRADGALVTTKTKYANIRLARKYGVPV